jgi:hypothetical protein
MSERDKRRNMALSLSKSKRQWIMELVNQGHKNKNGCRVHFQHRVAKAQETGVQRRKQESA